MLDSLYQTPIADASVLVAITHERHPKLLLTRRAAHMNSHAGEVSCVGGKHDAGDGNNVVTALREACEETALPPNKVQLIGQLPIQTSKSGMSVRPIVALIAPDLLLVPELGEISRIFWADFETLLTQPTVEYAVEYAMQDKIATILTPSWQVDGETVWGLTGRVIASLLETGFDRQLEWYYRIQNTRN
ncbi:DNA mismatch repair protein MutT [Psychrobacter sp. P11F6]|nr:DNA mismatch repair protein MutT [Psychrobacter sp. P11F6]